MTSLRAAALLLGASLLSGCAKDWSALATDRNAICIHETLNGPGFTNTTIVDRNWGCEMPGAVGQVGK